MDDSAITFDKIIVMKSHDKLKKIDIKNRTCYYFNDTIKIEDFDLDNICIDKKSYKKILVYDILYKSLIDYKLLRIRFDKADRFIKVYDGLYQTLRQDIYLISVKSGITYIISHNYATIKVDSYDSLPLEKAMTFRNLIIIVKSVWNKDNNYYFIIFLGKACYELPKK